jgi:phage terminase small subunit
MAQENTQPQSAYEQLKPKQRAFVDAYLANGYNATKAAEKCKYVNPAEEGSRLLRNVNIKRAIDEALKQNHLGADEVLARIADQGRSTIEDFISLDKKKNPVLDLKKAKELGRLHLVQKLTQRTFFDKGKNAEVNEIEVHLYNAQKSLTDLLRVHQLIGDRDKEKVERQLLEERLKIAQYEREELERKAKGGPSAQRLENRPRPQGGPGVGPCGLYHQALDIELYPLGPLAQIGAVDPHQNCPICGGEPFSYEAP